MRIPLAALAVLAALSPAMGHESWIAKGQYRNPGGEHCCGAHDCRVEHDAVTRTWGWSIEGEGAAHESIPYSEAMPTMDGQLWICRRPNGMRRCVFGILPGT